MVITGDESVRYWSGGKVRVRGNGMYSFSLSMSGCSHEE